MDRRQLGLPAYIPKDYGMANCLMCEKIFKRKSQNHKYCTSTCLNISYESYHTRYSKERLIIFDRDKFQCIYCGKTSYRDHKKLHLDHVIPKSKGGQDYAKNLVTSCMRCNLGKSDMTLCSQSIIIKEVERRNKRAGIHPDQLIKLSCQSLVKSLAKLSIVLPENQMQLFDLSEL